MINAEEREREKEKEQKLASVRTSQPTVCYGRGRNGGGEEVEVGEIAYLSSHSNPVRASCSTPVRVSECTESVLRLAKKREGEKERDNDTMITLKQ